jgi:RNA polymerase sigma-70 factor (ECF subfamily)
VAPGDVTPDQAWVDGLRRGDVRAFEEVYAAFHGRVVAYLARMLGQRDGADDLAQEVFVRLATAGPRLRPDTRLAPWLFTVARHVLISAARARRVRAQLAGELAHQVAPRPTTPFEAVAGSHAQLRLERALAALPPPQREVVVLVVLEGLATTDVATATGTSGENVRQRLARARAALASALGDVGNV